MRRDFLFLVHGVPQQYHFFDQHYFMALPTDAILEVLRKNSELVPGLRSFLEAGDLKHLVCIGFRNDFEDESVALGTAWGQLGGIIDGLSLLQENTVPQVCHIVQVREQDSSDVKLLIYKEGTWAFVQAKNPASQTAWTERTQKLFQRLMLFFDIAACDEAKFRTDLGYQQRYSAKMFRHGIEAGAWGIEYLCKFSALEGLVCGPQRKNKGPTLQHRLCSLFREPDLSSQIEDLWEMRCEGSHQARAFFAESLPDSRPLQCHIETVERLFLGTLVFALDHVNSAKTVNELWSKSGGYRLPAYASLKRPSDMPKIPAIRFIVNRGLIWRGVGVYFDYCFRATEQSCHLPEEQK